MKAKALSVKECTWMLEECHLVDEAHEESQKARLCLPNIFRSKKVKPFTRGQNGPTYQIYYTARELLLEVLDRGSIQELLRRGNRQLYRQGREQGPDLSEEEYSDALTWFSVVLQSGLSFGDDFSFGSELTLNLDGWQGVLKRNSFQTSLLSLTRLEDEVKLAALFAFCSHITRRYQTLYTPGPNLAVKKYTLFYKQMPCSLHLAILCDLATGFICNMYLYCPEQLHQRSRRPVVQQVIQHLLRPFCSNRHLVRVNSSVWMEGKLKDIFSNIGVNIHFIPSATSSVTDLTSVSSAASLHPNQQSLCKLTAHLHGWTGPALLPASDPKGPGGDVFLSGLWVTLHMICINTFVLHSLQIQGSGSQIQLPEFTRTLASQVVVDSSVPVPVLPRLHSSYQDSAATNVSTQRTNTNSCGPVRENEKQGCGQRLQDWSRPGVCGLDNSGNSCYINAVFQCLCSTVPLVEHLLQQDTRKDIARSKCRVAEVFVRLLEQMWLGKRSSCAPVEARSVLCSILPQFNNHLQQDAQELLLFFINVLHEDLKKVLGRQMHSSTRQPRLDQNRKCTRLVESTMVSHLFEGQLSCMTLCMHCHHQAHTTQSFNMLSLPIPTDAVKCSIQDCLSLFFEQTILTGAEQLLCSVCGLRRETSIVTYLDKPPEVLMLHLKRFGCKGKRQVKLRTNVLFSTEKLDLHPFLSNSLHNTLYASYSLYAVVNHTGHLHTGHYTALCHSALTQTWHCFDDSVVQQIQDSRVQSSHAYVLFYSRRPFHKPKIHGL